MIQLSPRARRCIREEFLHHLPADAEIAPAMISHVTVIELHRTPGLGNITIKEIKQWAAEAGFKLRDSPWSDELAEQKRREEHEAEKMAIEAETINRYVRYLDRRGFQVTLAGIRIRPKHS